MSEFFRWWIMLSVQVIALSLTAIQAFPEIKKGDYSSLAVILFFVLLAGVVASIAFLIANQRRITAPEDGSGNDDLRSRTAEVFTLRSELADTRNRIAELSGELERARPAMAELRQIREVEAKTAEEDTKSATILGKAPQLWVDYNDSKPHEILRFSKDGGPIKSIELGELVWNLQERRPISLFNVIGPVRSDPVDCKFTAFERHGNNERLYSLPGLLREMMQRYGVNAQPSLTVRYEDFEGHKFRRDFVLSIDPDDRIVFDPGPVIFQAGSKAAAGSP